MTDEACVVSFLSFFHDMDSVLRATRNASPNLSRSAHSNGPERTPAGRYGLQDLLESLVGP